MDMILGLVLFFSSAFYDGGSCTVQAYVYRDSRSESVSFARADACQGVRVEKDFQSVILYSPHVWVQVIIPVDKGHRRFMYRWGSEVAHLGPETVPIAWGYVEKG